MTYNEWRDELKSNLLSVSDEERRRVLDYYAEAYADRREAGYSERQIIMDFGAPFDAAQRILLNICDDGEYIEETPFHEKKETRFSQNDVRYSRVNDEEFYGKDNVNSTQYEAKNVKAEIVREDKQSFKQKAKSHPFLFAFLCLLLVFPAFVIIVSMFGVSIGILLAPLTLVGFGMANIACGILNAIRNGISGVYTIGVGLLELGIFIAIMPVLIKLVQIGWKQVKRMFVWLKSKFIKEGTRV